jgi:excisionase family DNA binding protein
VSTTNNAEPHLLRRLAEIMETQAQLVRALADEQDRAKAEAVAVPAPGGPGLSLTQASQRLGVSRRFVSRAIRRHELASTRLGPRTYRIDPAELERYRKRRALR